MPDKQQAAAVTPETATLPVPNLMRPMVLTTISTLVGMSSFQVIKLWLFPDITRIQSQVMTIIFTTIIATIAVYVMARRFQRLIYQQHLMELAFHASERRYRQMFRGNRAVKLLIDPATQAIVEANPAASAFYGYSVEALQQMKLSDLDGVALDQQRTRPAILALDDAPVEAARHRLASGAIRDVEMLGGPIDVDGQPLVY